jgi:hypothetical protein
MRNSKQEKQAVEETNATLVAMEDAVVEIDDALIGEAPIDVDYDFIAKPAGELTIAEAIGLRKELETYNSEASVKSWDINICVNDNLELLAQALRGVEAYERDLQKPLKQFQKEKDKMLFKYSCIDGVPQTVPTQDGSTIYMVPEKNKKAYAEAFEKLKAKHKDVLDTYSKRLNEHSDRIQEKVSTYKPIYLSREVAAKEAPQIETRFQALIYSLLEPLKKEDPKKK